MKVLRSLLLGLALLLITLGVLACETTQPSPPPKRADVLFINGKPDGPCVIYDGWGNVEIRGQFKDGQKEGVWSYFDSKGNKLAEISWRAGRKDGPCRMWFGRAIDGGKWLGNRKLEMDFSADRPDRTKRSWYPGGEKRMEVEYQNGAVRGARLWDPSGKESSPAEAARQAEDDWAADLEFFGVMEGEVQAGLANSGGQGTGP